MLPRVAAFDAPGLRHATPMMPLSLDALSAAADTFDYAAMLIFACHAAHAAYTTPFADYYHIYGAWSLVATMPICYIDAITAPPALRYAMMRHLVDGAMRRVTTTVARFTRAIAFARAVRSRLSTQMMNDDHARCAARAE